MSDPTTRGDRIGGIPHSRPVESDVEIRWVGKRTFLPEPHPGGGRTRETASLKPASPRRKTGAFASELDGCSRPVKARSEGGQDDQVALTHTTRFHALPQSEGHSG